MQPRGVLWDLDGTLVDSEEYHWRAWCETLAGHGVAITREQFQASFGQRNDAVLPVWLGPQGTPEQVRRIADAKEACYREAITKAGITALPGAAEWVKRLHEGGWRQAIASSAPKMNVRVILDALGLEPYIETFVSAEDVQRGKPDPQVFLIAAERVGVPPARCVVVEDALAGVEAARRAGMKCIGVCPTHKALPAAIVVSSLADLPEDAFEKLV